MATAEAHRRSGLAAVTGEHYEGSHWLGSFAFSWSQSESFQAICRFRLTSPRLLLDDCNAWTLNASLTRLSSYRKCSKRRILGHSAQATSLPPIEGTTKCSLTARGFGCGSSSGFAVEVKPKAGLGFRASAAFSRLETDCHADFPAGSHTLDIFLLLPVRDPSANRSLIAFTAWSSLPTPRLYEKCVGIGRPNQGVIRRWHVTLQKLHPESRREGGWR
jgi:hypothetical protein